MWAPWYVALGLVGSMQWGSGQHERSLCSTPECAVGSQTDSKSNQVSKPLIPQARRQRVVPRALALPTPRFPKVRFHQKSLPPVSKSWDTNRSNTLPRTLTSPPPHSLVTPSGPRHPSLGTLICKNLSPPHPKHPKFSHPEKCIYSRGRERQVCANNVCPMSGSTQLLQDVGQTVLMRTMEREASRRSQEKAQRWP